MKYLFLLFIASSVFGISFDISHKNIKNGQSAIIKFKAQEGVEYKHIRIEKNRYKIFDNYVVFPISYYEKPKKEKIIINYVQDDKWKFKIINFNIVDGKYKKERIHVQKSKVKLSPNDKKRAAIEYEEAMSIYNTINEENYITSEFIMPLNSKITSEFGKARVYNDTLNGYHSGTDFRAKVGTPLISSNDGVVVLVKDRFYSGGSVIIDHGYGVYLQYYHMSKFNVEVGQRVKKGQVIGLSGVTGRVTGPHLHFSARVGGIQVDPLQVIKLLNENILRN